MKSCHVVFLLALALAGAGCSKTVTTEPAASRPSDTTATNVPGAPIGEVYLEGYYADEFNRVTYKPKDTIFVHIAGTGVSIDTMLMPTKSSFELKGLPLQQYTFSGRQRGCYPTQVEIDLTDDWPYGSCQLFMLKVLPDSIRISSFECAVNPVTPRVEIDAIYAYTLPPKGRHILILLAGLTPEVSTQYGTYFFAREFIDSDPHQTIVDNVYQAFQGAGVRPGQRVFLAAYLGNAATYSTSDTTTGLPAYFSLTDRPAVRTSFVMP